MKNNLIALFLSILFHLIVLLLLFWRTFDDDENFIPKHGSKDGKRISIKELKFPKPSNATNTSDGALAQQAQETSIKREIKEEKKVEEIKKIKKNIENKKVKKQAKAQTKSAQAQKKSQNPQKHSSPSIYDYGYSMENQEIEELYGDEIYSMNLEERKFIESNLSAIGKITQKYLKYPRIAGRLGQQGDNIVEFYLYPNGDISDLRLISPLGYEILDDNTIRTIEMAYKDYPYPKKKTKIRIRVMYRIY